MGCSFTILAMMLLAAPPSPSSDLPPGVVEEPPTYTINPNAPPRSTGLIMPRRQPPSLVAWRTDYAGAVAASQQFGCPLLVLVECPECKWCIALDRATWSDEGVKKVLRENYVAVRIDGVQEKELATGLWVHRYPTIVLAAPDGTILSFEEGFADPGTMQFRLKRAVADAKAMRGKQMQEEEP